MRNKFDALNEIQGEPESTKKYWDIALWVVIMLLLIEVAQDILVTNCPVPLN